MTKEEAPLLNDAIALFRHPGDFRAVFSLPLNGSIAPCLSFLNASIIPKSLIPECLYQESK